MKASLFVSLIIMVVSQSVWTEDNLSTARTSREYYASHECIRDCSSSQAKECVYDFDIEYWSTLSRNCFDCPQNQADCYRAHCVTADGRQRGIKTVNRMLPGPSIQVCVNDTVVVRVHNELISRESITVHWHGVHIVPSMDGAEMITQCPILSGTSFEYKFQTTHPGTHFWHAHSAGQRADGIFGSLVVRQPNDPNSKEYDFDLPEHTIVLTDWYEEIFLVKTNEIIQTSGDEDPSSILIDGFGGDMNNESTSDWPRAQIDVDFGARYRFRFINAGIGYCPLEVSIANHSITIVSLDGNPVEPFQVASFFILAGERVDFVIEANAEPDAYWIKARGVGDCEDGEVFQTAILKYTTSNKTQPDSIITYDTAGPDVDGKVFNPVNVKIDEHNRDDYIVVDESKSIRDEYTSETLEKIRKKPDKKFFLALDMNYVKNTMVYDDSTFDVDEKFGFDPFVSPQINNITFKHPNVPLIYQYQKPPETDFCYENDETTMCAKDKFCKCIHMIKVDLNDLVELVIADGGSGAENHPIHLHGYSFGVLGVEKLGSTVFMPDIKRMDERGQLKRNLDSPPLKDTVTIPSGGYTIVRFYANRPGVWFMHCHVQLHADTGMMMVVKVGESRDLPEMDLNSWPQCGNYPSHSTPHVDTPSSKTLIYIISGCVSVVLIVLAASLGFYSGKKSSAKNMNYHKFGLEDVK